MPTPPVPVAGHSSSSTATRAEVAPASAALTAVGRYRWYICGLLFFASTINYVDRQVIGILKPTLQAEFGWSEIDYSDIVFAFQFAYAIGLLIAGRMTPERRRVVGLTLLGIGAATTVPAAVAVFRGIERTV